MNKPQACYDTFSAGRWAEPDAEHCPCRGTGWANSEVEAWHQCPIHFCGQLHPEAYDLEASDEEFETLVRIAKAEYAVRVACGIAARVEAEHVLHEERMRAYALTPEIYATPTIQAPPLVEDEFHVQF